jgi:hypothetical protein
MRNDRNKLDLTTLLALAGQYSPERQVAADLDRAKLGELLASQQYAQQLGYPSMTAMKLSQEDADRNDRLGLQQEARTQAGTYNQMQAATAAGRVDLLPYMFEKAYPGMPPAPQPPPKKEKKSWFGLF